MQSAYFYVFAFLDISLIEQTLHALGVVKVPKHEFLNDGFSPFPKTAFFFLRMIGQRSLGNTSEKGVIFVPFSPFLKLIFLKLTFGPMSQTEKKPQQQQHNSSQEQLAIPHCLCNPTPKCPE